MRACGNRGIDMTDYIKRKIRKVTHRIWNQEIARLLLLAHSRREIDSHQLHVLASMFDPTQEHEVRT